MKKQKGITLIALVVTIVVLLILAGVSLNLVLGNNGIIAKTKDAREKTQMAEARDDVDLAVANMKIEALQRTMTQEEKRQSIENELKKIRPESTVTINGSEFIAKHKGYEFEISDTGEISVSEPFDAEKWDKTAAPEDVFIWQSDNPNDEGYGVVVGYNENVQNYTTLRYPSRCTKITEEESYISPNWSMRAYTNNIKEIELPDTVVEIGTQAFSFFDDWGPRGPSGYYFKTLEKVTIPGSVKSIGDYAFAGDISLKMLQ